MPNIFAALLFIVAFSTLSGCGQTGPLYMPGETQPKHKHAGSSDAFKPTRVEPAGSSGAVAQPQDKSADGNNAAEDPLISP